MMQSTRILTIPMVGTMRSAHGGCCVRWLNSEMRQSMPVWQWHPLQTKASTVTLFGGKSCALKVSHSGGGGGGVRSLYTSVSIVPPPYSRSRLLHLVSSNQSNYTTTAMDFYHDKLDQKCESKLPIPKLILPARIPAHQPSAKRGFRIIVEGNVGSGKTTFLSIFENSCCSSLKKKPLVIPEPIHLWRNVGGTNIFQLLADDPKRWSFAFQSYAQLTMLKIHEMAHDEDTIKIMERSIYSARYCFAENLLRSGLLHACEFTILDECFKHTVQNADVDLIIYLRTDPAVAHKRIMARGRPEETGITEEFISVLHDRHEDWLIREKFPLPAPVLTIDANIPLDEIKPIYEEKTGGILRQHMTV